MTLWLGPLSVRTFRTIEDRLRAGQASFQVAPRVFDERFPHMVLYVNDIDSAATHWKGVFLAEHRHKDVSRLTLAEDAIVIADRSEGKLELHLRNGSVHEFTPSDPGHYSLSAFGQRDFPVDVQGAEERPRFRSRHPRPHHERPVASSAKLSATPAWNFSAASRFPFACISFALLAMPLGARPRRGGRAAGFLITLLLITGYYLMFTIGAGFARQGTIPVWVGIWSANVITAASGFIFCPAWSACRAAAGPAPLIERICRVARLEDFLSGRPANCGNSERLPCLEKFFPQEKRPRAAFRSCSTSTCCAAFTIISCC